MKHTKKISTLCVLALLLAFNTHAAAQIIPAEKAQALASEFLTSKGKDNNRLTLAKTANDKAGNPLYYILNNSSNDSYVIVSAEENCVNSILGYSLQGAWEEDKMPEALLHQLDAYGEGIRKVRLMPQKESKLHKARLRSQRKAVSQKPVDPLLGNIEWNQWYPYNRYMPVMKGKVTYIYPDEHTETVEEDIQCPTGCVATAIAQVMYYHRWPAQGKGSNSYDWNGQTLSADFSQSTYAWDKMLPQYTYDADEEACQAVALLMRDVGYACNMEYASGGSSAGSEQSAVLINNFSYGKGIGYLDKQYCSSEQWEEVLLSEFEAKRPVLCNGGSDAGGHMFICDGYDGEGHFHYNFGWGGANNAFLLPSATGFDSNPAISFGIEPEDGNSKTRLVVYSEDNFMYSEHDNQIKASVTALSLGERVKIEFAIAYKNTETGEVGYYTVISSPEPMNYYWLGNVLFYEPLPDGKYVLYPVARIQGEEWQTAYSSEFKQIQIDLTVKDGVKTYENNGLYEDILDVVTCIDNIYYILDENTLTASVTYKNTNYECYAGNVTVPSTVSYEGQEYTVTAFTKYGMASNTELKSVHIPATVTTLPYAAVADNLNLEYVTIEEGSQLQYIGNWAFNAASLHSFDFPETVQEIGMCAFQGCNKMTDVFVHWTTTESLPYVHPLAFNGAPLNEATLYVPVGTKEIYENADIWKDFGRIVEATDGIQKMVAIPTWQPKKLMKNGKVVIRSNNQEFTTAGTQFK